MAGPLFVQAASGSGTTSPITVTLGSATGAGNCLVVAVGMGNSTTNPTVSGITLGGSAGNFASAVALSNNADANVAIWTDQSCAGGQTSVVVTFTAGTGAGNGYNVWVFEFSGVQATAAVDQTASTGAASGTTWTSGATGTLSSTSEVAVGVSAGIGAVGAPSFAGPSSPWINEAGLTAARTAMVAGYQILASNAAVTYSGTISAGRNAGAVITLLGTTPPAASPAPVRAGRTYLRRFQRELLHVFPPQPSQPVTAAGSAALAPMATGGQAAPSYPVPPQRPGLTWTRRFSRGRLHVRPPQPPQADIAQVAIALAPMALGGQGAVSYPVPPQRPGRTWTRRFSPERIHVRPPQPSQPVLFSAAMAMAPMAAGGAGTESQPIVPTRPGRTWLRRFQRESLRVFPRQPSQPASSTGTMAMAPMALSSTAIEVIIVPPQRPGLTWRRLHQTGRQHPLQPSQPVTSSGSAAMAPMGLLGAQRQPGWIAPAFPGRTWARIFARERHQVPPRPSQPVITRGTMAMAPMVLSGSATEVLVVPPQRPGRTWARRYRLGRLAPLQPSQPVTSSGLMPLRPMRISGLSQFAGSTGTMAMAPVSLSGTSLFSGSTGSAALAPMALGGQAAEILPYPPQRPGRTWRRRFISGRMRFPQPSQPVSSTGSAAMAPMALSARAQQLLSAPPAQRPGRTWRRFHRYGRQVPLQPSQPVSSSGSAVMAPMSLGGSATEVRPYPPQRPGLTWRRYHRLGRQRPLQPPQRLIVSGSLPLAPVIPRGGPVTLAASCSGSLALAPLAIAGAHAAVNPTTWQGTGFMAFRAVTGPDITALWAAYMRAQQKEQAAENLLREAELAGGSQILGQYYAAYKAATDAARQAYLDWAAAVKQFELDSGHFAAYNGAE